MTDDLIRAVREYFDKCDANHPPQTRGEFVLACMLAQGARNKMRLVLEEYEKQ